MVRNSNNWASNEEEESSIELDLGLSVGGCYSKPKRTVLDPSLGEINDQKTKREIHALRRQEAKKKQQLKRGFSKVTKNGDFLSKVNDFTPECKKIKGEENGSDRNLTVDGKIGYCNAAAAPPFTTAENGFVFPCNVMSCWFAGAGAAAGQEKNGAPVNVQPVIGYGFVSLGLDNGLGNGYGSEDNCSGDRGNGKSGSNGSDKCTSSSGSDQRNPCNEGEGGNSTSTRSHSSSKQQQPNDSKLNETKSTISESTSIEEVTHTNAANVVPSNTPNPTLVGTISQPSSEPEPKRCAIDGKPPKPPTRVQTNPPLPHMPCVSTTGNGPNGRTVNGFLYRYTKTEVSIVCVCHGSSFSPAEFVQHAGGTDVSHPLKHITVVSSAV